MLLNVTNQILPGANFEVGLYIAAFQLFLHDKCFNLNLVAAILLVFKLM